MKEKVFLRELSYMKNNDLRNFAEFVLSKAPDYFYEIPASSTGKYHPLINQGKGGLVNHVKLAVAIARDSFNLEKFPFSEREHDLVIVSVLLHDIYKSGKNPTKDEISGSKTDFEHPRIAAEFIKKCNKYLETKGQAIKEEDLNCICGCVKSHMGQWNKKEGLKDLPKPITPMQLCVSNADYMASRRLYDEFYLNLLKEFGYNINIDSSTNSVVKNEDRCM